MESFSFVASDGVVLNLQNEIEAKNKRKGI
jgi:hypothetical protein